MSQTYVPMIQDTIRRELGVGSIEGETKGYGMVDYTLKDLRGTTLEWKTNRYEHLESYRKGMIIFENYSKLEEKPKRGNNIFTCTTDLFAHTFKSESGRSIQAGVIFHREPLTKHLIENESHYLDMALKRHETYRSKGWATKYNEKFGQEATFNISGAYHTGWIRVPNTDIKHLEVKRFGV